jgi:hypothetical protein
VARWDNFNALAPVLSLKCPDLWTTCPPIWADLRMESQRYDILRRLKMDKALKLIPMTMLIVALLLAVGGRVRSVGSGQGTARTNTNDHATPRNRTPTAKALSPDFVDAGEKSFALLGKPKDRSLIEYGLERPTPVRANRVVITYASLAGWVFHPALGRQDLQCWKGGQWVVTAGPSNYGPHEASVPSLSPRRRW